MRLTPVCLRWSTGANPGSGYRATNLDQPFVGHMRERSDSLGYGPYLNQVEDPFRKESDICSQVRLYDQQDFDPLRSNYLVGQNSVSGQIGLYPSTSGHSHFGSAAESSYRMNTSAMQRYAPRLDELNYMRMGALGPEPALGYEPHVFRSNVPFDPRAATPTRSAWWLHGVCSWSSPKLFKPNFSRLAEQVCSM